MKKTFVAAGSLLLVSYSAQAQFVVSDPAHTVVSSISQGIHTIVQGISSTHKFLTEDLKNMTQDWYTSLKLVTNTIKDIKEAKAIYDNQDKLFHLYIDGVKMITTDPNLTVEQREYYLKVYAAIWKDNEKVVKKMLTALTSGQTQMTDKERIDLVLTCNQEINSLLMAMSGWTKVTSSQILQGNQQSVSQQLVTTYLGKQPQ